MEGRHKVGKIKQMSEMLKKNFEAGFFFKVKICRSISIFVQKFILLFMFNTLKNIRG